MKVLVMGGGMSGLATAINLLDLGFEVELVEADEMFGGRANSWIDQDGDMIDNALHVFFPYYVNLMNFFKKMGIGKNIIWKDTKFYFAQEEGNQPVLQFKKYPAPLHTVTAFFGLVKNYKGIPKWKILLTTIGLAHVVGASKKEMDELDKMSWAEWTMRRGPKGAFKPFESAIHGLTFTPVWAISAKVMVNWFKKVSAAPDTARVGFANGGLGEIWVHNCLDYIKKKGGTYALNQEVTSINIEKNKIKSITINGKEEKTADIYVSAMTPYALRKILPDDVFKHEYFQDLHHFQNAPSLSIQIWFDRKLTDVDVTFFSTDCIFNTYADLSNVLPHIFKGGSMFEMVIAPADHVRGLPDEIIYEKAISDIKKLFPTARDAKVKKWTVVRKRQGVYRAHPGMETHRPDQRSPLANFYLTGDYTKTEVSSGGMEAAMWTANHCAELMAQDKLGKTVSLTAEFNPPKGFNALIRPAMYTTGMAAIFLLGKILSRLIVKR